MRQDSTVACCLRDCWLPEREKVCLFWRGGATGSKGASQEKISGTVCYVSTV